MGPSANRFQHHFKLRTVCVCVPWSFLVTMAFFEVHVYNDLEYFLQELASSLSFWKRCKFSSNIKTSFQISSWSYCAYIVVLLSKKFGILWKIGGKLLFFLFKNKTPRGRCKIVLWNWTSIPHVILLHTQHLFWNKMAFGWSLKELFWEVPCAKW